ncbi:TetR family transcriptional regulator [Streptomyces spiroverticillatus]|uniref:TetR family transcriptional regulator n=1 Tax=Streptomyces finlayi TaxID=67296 RepID=A0A918WWW8_9ACTN|nr:TetR/AcrR family transcriptional regulator [Streptomyces finlayi]GHA08489.1 TetR family transcriptional regulator [Streptomyces spiroverticillatus]GHC91455.1 TetR family transcriptional regulator [Streptomyces finlayi]
MEPTASPDAPRQIPLRERLVDAGVELVESGGPGSLGLREIARRAGVSHGAPRRYFPTHHSLLSAIARRGFDDLKVRFERVGGEAGSAPEEQLRALARSYVDFALERRGMFELMFRHDLLASEVHAAGAEGPRLREETLPLLTAVAALIGRCRNSHAASAPEAAAALWANLHGIAQLWTWGSLPLALDVPPGGGPASREALDRLVKAAVDAHLGGPRQVTV